MYLLLNVTVQKRAEHELLPCYFLFSDVLADNGRLTLTGDVIAAFGKMMSAHRGEVLCSVTTAQV